MHNLGLFAMMLSIALTPSSASFADATAEAVVTSLMSKELPDVPGKEMVMITVTYPPGTVERIHRHDAHAILSVQEGLIVEQ